MPAKRVDWAAIEETFIERAHAMAWCNMATLDQLGRPRSRVVHPLWLGREGWMITRTGAPKVAHIAAQPLVSLAYVKDIVRPVYADCRATLVSDVETKSRLFTAFAAAPEPVGFDPAKMFGPPENPDLALIRFDPWRVECADIAGRGGLVWREG